MDFWGKMLNAAGTALNVDAKDLTDLGNEQVDLSTGEVHTLTVPSGARIAYIEAEGQTARWCNNAATPSASVGIRLLKDNCLWYQGELAKFKAIAETNIGAKLNVAYYK